MGSTGLDNAFGLWRKHKAVRWAAMSGAAALIYQITFQKLLSYVLGGALLSTTIVVGSFMTGLALGGLVAGFIGDRLTHRRNLGLYLLLETGIGVCGIAGLAAYLAYLSMMDNLVADPWFISVLSSTALRATSCFVGLLPMTTLMGATLPILVKAVKNVPASTEAESDRVSVSELYSGNLLGAVLGAVVSAFVILPYSGLWGAFAVGVVFNAVIAVSVIRSLKSAASGRASEEQEDRARLGTATVSYTALSSGLLSFISGLVIFALEIIWTHLLAVIIGASVYAFTHMLFAVLLALYFAARREEKVEENKVSLPRLILTGSALLALTIPFYALSPFLFSAVGLLGPGFVVRELFRLAVACLLIVPPGIYLSRILPRLLAVAVPEDRQSRAVGILLGVNTFGCLCGLFLGRFFLVPVLGSEISLKLLVGLLVAVSAFMLIKTEGRARLTASLFEGKRKWVTVIAAVALIAPSWYPPWLLSARNAYFDLGSKLNYKELKYIGEDAETGFITVMRRQRDDALDLRTNGKFEGDDGDQMAAQIAFGSLPVLAARENKRAFIVGLGTGTTLSVFDVFPFEQIDVAELSREVHHAAKIYFGHANSKILEDARVNMLFDDGRSALALSEGRYDVVSIAITSIWFAGAANLYSRDFYSVVQKKLAPGGVFQQWVQMHHMRTGDLWVILNTVRSTFKHVALWYSGDQGQIVASDEPISLDWQRLQKMVDASRRHKNVPSQTFYEIPTKILLDSAGVDKFVETMHSDVGKTLADMFVSSDLYPYLEYATPKGNAQQQLQHVNLSYLRRLSPKPVQIKIRNIVPEDRPLAEAVLSHSRGDCAQVKRFAESHPDEAARPELSFLRDCAPTVELQFE